MPTKRALIVDDSTTAQYRLKKMLRNYDLHIDTVDSGEAALLHLATHVPDVIFMDHLMPGMDGFRALQIIKSHPETAMIPVIMYTSKSGDVYTGQARALGALDVIHKDTINSADLSKVMGGIHIYTRKAQEEAASQPQGGIEADSEIQPQLDISELPAADILPALSRSDANANDNSRRIELRISQLEHAIDDSRRVITARLVREIQKLRHNISHEISEQMPRMAPIASANTINENEELLTPEPTSSRHDNLLVFIVLIFVLLLGALMFNSFSKLDQRLSALSEQQAEQRRHMETVSKTLQATQDSLKTQLGLLSQPNPAAASYVVKSAMLNDMVRAFNQDAVVPFSPGIVDAASIRRLNDFIYRIGERGFKGAVWVNLSAGDFCVQTNTSGQIQLPNPDALMSDCTLLSELFRIENLVDQAMEEINNSVSQINSVGRGDINVIVSRQDSQPMNYPARQPQARAQDWNKIAQNNSRLSVELSDLDSIQ